MTDVHVIKIGGALVAADLNPAIEDIAELIKEGYKFVIVHGGGPQINDIESKMGRQPKIYETQQGMKTRYTDRETMDVVLMALGGFVNKTLVEKFMLKGIKAFGFTGLDGSCIKAERKDKIMVIKDGKRIILRGEFSGKVSTVDPTPIKLILDAGYLPIIGSISADEQGNAVNTDGDRAASAVAAALGATSLISLTDVPGIYKDMETKEIIPKLSVKEAKQMIESLSGGMKKKLYAALEAFEHSIKKVYIYSGQEPKPFTAVLKEGKGTVIYNE
jgi:acetylglutamate/LysW-gamma-L-alpha-aminoadipate kinase